MAVHDLRKASNIASGQKTVSLDGNLEERVSNIEDKLDEKLFCEVEKKSYEKIIFDKK